MKRIIFMCFAAILFVVDGHAQFRINGDGVLTGYTGPGGGVVIPNTVKIIGDRAFANCTTIVSVTIPGSVTEIGEWAFPGCISLTSVTIPGSVTKIGERAFSWCGSLTDVTVKWATPLSIAGNTFSGVPLASGTLHVPAGTKALYKAADVWKNFSFISDDAGVGTEVIRAAEVQVHINGSLLSVDSPAAEQIAVYSVGGQLLHRVRKTAGPATFNLDGLPRGVLIVRGSSGWVRKVVR
jgi:hypothetical protein